MQLALQYLQMRHGMKESVEHKAYKVAVEDLTSILYCTSRNVKIIIKKMKDQGWIEWESGRGRGNTSTIVFLASKEKLLLEETVDLAKKGELREAWNLIRLYGEKTQTREKFMDWLASYFGYSSEPQEQQYVQTLRFPVYRPIFTLDPAYMFYALDANLVKQIFDRLVRFNSQTGLIEPQLAHHWESDASGCRWTFYLRRGVLFHHGREMTAEDVAYSFTRMRDLQSKGRRTQHWLFEKVESVEFPNRHCIKITLSEPNYLFPNYLCCPSASIVPSDVCEERGESFALNPVGTGPFQVKSLTPDRCLLEAFVPYYQGRAHLDRVEVISMPDDEHLQVKEPDWDQLILTHRGPIAKKTDELKEINEMYAGCSLLTFNLNKQGPQRHPAFRRALHHLVNREAMIQTLGENRIYTARSFQPDNSLTAFDRAYNPDLARKLLQEAGCRDEVLQLFTYEKHAPDAYWVQQQCEKFGIQSAVTVLGEEEIRKEDRIAEADCILYEIVLDEDIVSQIELFKLDGNFIREHLSKPLMKRIDAAISQALREPTPELRTDWLKPLEQLLGDECALLFLLHKSTNTSFHSTLRGVNLNSLGWIDFHQIWFQPKNTLP